MQFNNIYYNKIGLVIYLQIFNVKKVKSIYNTNIIMITKPKIAILIFVLFFSTAMISVPSVYTAIEEVEEYAESRCSEYDGEWEDGRCEIEDKEQEQEFMDDVASLEDSICEDDEVKDIDHEDWIDLCKNINIFKN